MTEEVRKKSKRGFGSMDPEKQREIAKMGGMAVPKEKRIFFTDRAAAAAAGAKGGRACPSEKRTFTRDPDLAATAGRKGGQAPSKKSHQSARKPA